MTDQPDSYGPTFVGVDAGAHVLLLSLYMYYYCLRGAAVHVRHGANCNYFMRKWGCPSEAGNWMAMTDDCKFRTPFNKSVPHWWVRFSTAKSCGEYRLQATGRMNAM